MRALLLLSFAFLVSTNAYDYYNHIPTYEANRGILEQIGQQYPALEKQSRVNVLREDIAAKDGNIFKKIHATIQKNNEQPITYESDEVYKQSEKDKSSLSKTFSGLFDEYQDFGQNLIEPSKDDELENALNAAQKSEYTFKPFPVMKPIEKVDLTRNYEALREHQQDQERRLHTLAHAIDFISESISDPLHDEYQKGINEMIEKHLTRTQTLHDSPLFGHLAYHHAFKSPELGERVAKQIMVNDLHSQPNATPAVKPVNDLPAQTNATPAVKPEDEQKDKLRQKTVEQSQVRPLETETK